MCIHTAIYLQKQGENWLMISYLLFRSQSHGDDNSVSCDIGTAWTAQMGKLTDCWWGTQGPSQGEEEEVLSGKPYCWHSNLANRALDCSILASSCQTLWALQPVTIFLGAHFLFPSWYTLNFHFLNKSFKSQCFVIRTM